MGIVLPEDVNNGVIDGTKRILTMLRANGWKEESMPRITPKGAVRGEALVGACSILGIEKYLGMIDNKERIAYFSSVKLTNDSTVAKTYLRFDPDLKEDLVFIGDKEAEGREKERVINTVNRFRDVTGITSRMICISRNEFKGGVVGKGLGTSAAAGAALAAAMVYSGVPEHAKNITFMESIARMLAGSAPQSVAGGFSVWLSDSSYLTRPGESYSVRLDKGDFDIKLVVVPIMQSAKTEEAHDAAVKSPHYVDWCSKKAAAVPDLVDAIMKKDIKRVGEHAEDDTIWLNKIIKTGGGIDNWEPDTRVFIEEVKRLRQKGIIAYYSMDTGPSVAVITTSKDAEKVKQELENALNGKYKGKIFVANLAGSPKVLPVGKKDSLITPGVKAILNSKGIAI